MSTASLVILAVLFFLTSVIGVVTGSNSLITVPVMFQFGIPEKEAVATNMFGLVFMAIGGTIPFVQARVIKFRRTSPLVIMTIVSSAIGAALVGLITDRSIKLIVSIAMVVVALFILVGPRRKQTVYESPRLEQRWPAPTLWSAGFNWLVLVGYVLTFLLGIYGGLYSGGYVTILTAVFVAFLGMEFGEAIAVTKWVNVFSSSVATIVFMWQGLVNYKLGIILGATMFVGAYVGAHYATKMNDTWLRRIFLATVFLLALKTLFDFV